ncbi:MAG TPA: helix-turn-helix transcriptional regulator [Acidimicrobiia bacterium]|nr:helix-turn-helix transcriptional regulator [Acidimicrobiia bacterium]
MPEAYPRELLTLGDHLRKRRLDLGLLQKDVAARLGVTKDTVRNWERNRTEPVARLVPRIVRFLGYLPRRAPESFTDRFALYRRSKGLTQRQLAARLGIDPTTVGRWESGRGLPSDRLKRRAELLISIRLAPPPASPC